MRQPTPAPGALLDAGLLGAMGRWTWGAGAPEHPVAIALLAPPPQAGRKVACAVQALAEKTGMAPASELIPDIGPRVRVASESQLAACFDTASYTLLLPATPEVVALARRTGTLALALGLDPLFANVAWECVTQYVRQGVVTDRIWFGSAGLLPEEVTASSAVG
ncbi:hypothetical protein ACWCQN_34180 [Streptomyces sp. NPDC001984]|uniref:hypothetical protein n=1 Tax=Streptomyces sp. NPDC002619 TaxID=3364655 RepID=UPI00368333B8